MVEEIETEPIILKSKKNRKTKYEVPEVQEFVVSMRNRDATWKEITQELRERGYSTISEPAVKRVFQKMEAKNITISNVAKEKFDDYSETLNLMKGRGLKVLNMLLTSLETIATDLFLDKVEDGQTAETDEKRRKFVKLAPEIKMLLSEIREQINQEIDHQDKVIKITQSQQMTEADVVQYINEYSEGVLKAKAEELVNRISHTFQLTESEAEKLREEIYSVISN